MRPLTSARMRTLTRSTLLLLVAGVVAACSESTVAPVAPAEELPALDVPASAYLADGSIQFSFVLQPTAARYVLGSHSLQVPARAVCDPATTVYQTTDANAPCEPATTGVEITARIVSRDGRLWTDFTPDIRFAPGKDVWLKVWNPAVVGATGDLGRYYLAYSPTIFAPGIVDWSEPTYVNLETGIVKRRITHFSGYNVHAGRSETDSTVTGPVVPTDSN